MLVYSESTPDIDISLALDGVINDLSHLKLNDEVSCPLADPHVGAASSPSACYPAQLRKTSPKQLERAELQQKEKLAEVLAAAASTNLPESTWRPPPVSAPIVMRAPPMPKAGFVLTSFVSLRLLNEPHTT